MVKVPTIYANLYSRKHNTAIYNSPGMIEYFLNSTNK